MLEIHDQVCPIRVEKDPLSNLDDSPPIDPWARFEEPTLQTVKAQGTHFPQSMEHRQDL